MLEALIKPEESQEMKNIHAEFAAWELTLWLLLCTLTRLAHWEGRKCSTYLVATSQSPNPEQAEQRCVGC
jgi:hypothetical protein